MKDTIFTFWLSCSTLISSEKDERVMEYLFFCYRKNTIDFFISLFRHFGLYYTDTIHNSVDMRIDSDIGHIIEY